MTSDENEKTKLLTVRVTEEEKRALKARADEYHLNLSRYLIMIGLKGRVQ